MGRAKQAAHIHGFRNSLSANAEITTHNSLQHNILSVIGRKIGQNQPII
jgi:hypothetical protein